MSVDIVNITYIYIYKQQIIFMRRNYKNMIIINELIIYMRFKFFLSPSSRSFFTSSNVISENLIFNYLKRSIYREILIETLFNDYFSLIDH